MRAEMAKGKGKAGERESGGKSGKVETGKVEGGNVEGGKVEGGKGEAGTGDTGKTEAGDREAEKGPPKAFSAFTDVATCPRARALSVIGESRQDGALPGRWSEPSMRENRH